MSLLRVALIIAVFGAAATSLPSSSSSSSWLLSDDGTLVQTAQGPVQGYSGADGVRIWRGIPYAAAPVGEWRLTHAVTHEPWSSPLNATRDGPGCVQHSDDLLPPMLTPPEQSEDCLFLNVFAPPAATATAVVENNNKKNADSRGGGKGGGGGGGGALAPVLVFFHGGNFKVGYGGGPLYDGSYLAGQQGLVLVSLNYRLNSLGFMCVFSSRF
jgi:para-nitrobenzyl esterase